MSIEMKGGASVHEIWTDLPDGTFIAYCEYFDDAVVLAESRVKHMPRNCRYLVVSHYDGRSKLVTHTTTETNNVG